MKRTILNLSFLGFVFLQFLHLFPRSRTQPLRAGPATARTRGSGPAAGPPRDANIPAIQTATTPQVITPPVSREAGIVMVIPIKSQSTGVNE